MSRRFMLVYDWACGQVVSLEEAADDGAAAALAYADDPSIEVRIVTADSREEALRGLSGPSAAPSP